MCRLLFFATISLHWAICSAKPRVDPCERQSYRADCPPDDEGKSRPSQFVLRYYRRGSQCLSYPYGWCSGRGANEPALFKTRADCQRYCLSAGEYSPIDPSDRFSTTAVPLVQTIVPKVPTTTTTTTTPVVVEEQTPKFTPTTTVWQQSLQSNGTASKSKCRQQRLEALRASQGVVGSKVSIEAAFVPECLADGSYQPIQCDVLSLSCWCVDSNGFEKPGTRVTDGRRPDCADYVAIVAATKLDGRCLEPADAGPCKSNLERWYFDPEDRLCKSLAYGGCGGNSNNFLSKEACDKQCNAAVAVNRLCPDWSSVLTDEDGQAYECLRRPCPNGYKCFVSIDEAYCCADREANALAASLMVGDPSACKYPKDRGPCGNFELRFYYDLDELECRYFFYGGCGGNKNNFKSINECQHLCSRRPLPKHAEVTEAPLPRVTESRPPKVENKCIFPMDPGPCSGQHTRWYYDQAKGVCEAFIYTGCGGNPNNFESLIGCQETCLELDVDVCAHPPDSGACLESFQRWYYDHSSKECKRFTYGGCGGNGNNFAHKHACETRCQRKVAAPMVGATEIAEPVRVTAPPSEALPTVLSLNRCFHPKSYGSCRMHFSRWYYDEMEDVCKPFIYSGCGGNGNNFESQQQCQKTCPNEKKSTTVALGRPQALPSSPCLHPKDPGPCGAAHKRWYYDSRMRMCAPFLYSGCGGTGNNFHSFSDCLVKCDAEMLQQRCLHPADHGECSGKFVRFYFDNQTRSCKEYLYGGCGGTGNNFATKLDCSKACGLPLTADQQHQQQQQQEAEHKPMEVKPTLVVPQLDVCRQPKVRGNCKHYELRYFFNSDSERCEFFFYSGCGGNQNNFNTLNQCELLCSKKRTLPLHFGSAQRDTFELPKARPQSPGSADQEPAALMETGESVLYGSTSPAEVTPPARTETFSQYFPTERTAPGDRPIMPGSSASTGSTPDVTTGSQVGIVFRHKCDYPKEVGPCTGSMTRWYWDKTKAKCVSFTYGGCKGNSNNFESEEQCQHECKGLPEHVCNHPKEAGQCRGFFPRWYFNSDSGKCEQFIYGGCGGNGNNFATEQSCQDTCVTGLSGPDSQTVVYESLPPAGHDLTSYTRQGLAPGEHPRVPGISVAYETRPTDGTRPGGLDVYGITPPLARPATIGIPGPREKPAEAGFRPSTPAAGLPSRLPGVPVGPAEAAGVPVGPAEAAGVPVGPAEAAGVPVGPAEAAGVPVGPAEAAGVPVGPAEVAGVPVGPAEAAGVPVGPAEVAGEAVGIPKPTRPEAGTELPMEVSVQEIGTLPPITEEIYAPGRPGGEVAPAEAAVESEATTRATFDFTEKPEEGAEEEEELPHATRRPLTTTTESTCMMLAKCLPGWLITVDDRGCQRCVYPASITTLEEGEVTPSPPSPVCLREPASCLDGEALVVDKDTGCKRCEKMETTTASVCEVSKDIVCEDFCMVVTDENGCNTCLCPEIATLPTTSATEEPCGKEACPTEAPPPCTGTTDQFGNEVCVFPTRGPPPGPPAPTAVQPVPTTARPAPMPARPAPESVPRGRGPPPPSPPRPVTTVEPIFQTYFPNVTTPEDMESVKLKCTEPLDVGSCRGPLSTRYWFNSATRTCEPFRYRGCGGNRNHFYSKQECEAHCGRHFGAPAPPVQRPSVSIEYPGAVGGSPEYTLTTPAYKHPMPGRPSARPQIPASLEIPSARAPGFYPSSPESTPPIRGGTAPYAFSTAEPVGVTDEAFYPMQHVGAPGSMPRSPGFRPLAPHRPETPYTHRPQQPQYPLTQQPQYPQAQQPRLAYPTPETRGVPQWTTVDVAPPTVPEMQHRSMYPSTPPVHPYEAAEEPSYGQPWGVPVSYPEPAAPVPSPYDGGAPVMVPRPQDSRHLLYCPDSEIPMQYKNGTMLRCLPGQNLCPPKSRCYFNGMDYFCCSTGEYEGSVPRTEVRSPYK